jgi:hypothetical protein
LPIPPTIAQRREVKWNCRLLFDDRGETEQPAGRSDCQTVLVLVDVMCGEVSG